MISVCCLCGTVVESNKTMSESEENSDSEAQTGGGRASVESVSEFLKEFKSARMSFEPLDTWLFVKARDDSSHDIESASDTNDISASSESASSLVYHFDSDEVSSSDDDDDDKTANIVSDAASCIYAVDDKGCDKGNALIVKNLADSPGRSGCGIKVFREADQSDIVEEDDCAFSDASLNNSCSFRNSTVSDQKCISDRHQPALSGVGVYSQSRVCSYATDDVCGDHAPVTAQNEHITYRASKCHKDVYNACDIFNKFGSSVEKSSKFAVETISVSHRCANQDAVNIASPSPTRTVCNDSTDEYNSAEVDNKADVNDTLKRNNKRQRIAQELMDTEATYQRHLELIIQVLFLFIYYCTI